MGCSGSTAAAGFEKNVVPLLEDMMVTNAQMALKHIDKMLEDTKLKAPQTISLQKLQVQALKTQVAAADAGAGALGGP
jgi:hypothetical protein